MSEAGGVEEGPGLEGEREEVEQEVVPSAEETTKDERNESTGSSDTNEQPAKGGESPEKSPKKPDLKNLKAKILAGMKTEFNSVEDRAWRLQQLAKESTSPKKSGAAQPSSALTLSPSTSRKSMEPTISPSTAQKSEPSSPSLSRKSEPSSPSLSQKNEPSSPSLSRKNELTSPQSRKNDSSSPSMPRKSESSSPSLSKKNEPSSSPSLSRKNIDQHNQDSEIPDSISDAGSESDPFRPLPRALDSASEAGSESSDQPLRRSLRLSRTSKLPVEDANPEKRSQKTKRLVDVGNDKLLPPEKLPEPEKDPELCDVIQVVKEEEVTVTKDEDTPLPGSEETSVIDELPLEQPNPPSSPGLLLKPQFTKTGKRKYRAFKGLNYSFGYKKKQRRSGSHPRDSASSGGSVVEKKLDPPPVKVLKTPDLRIEKRTIMLSPKATCTKVGKKDTTGLGIKGQRPKVAMAEVKQEVKPLSLHLRPRRRRDGDDSDSTNTSSTSGSINSERTKRPRRMVSCRNPGNCCNGTSEIPSPSPADMSPEAAAKPESSVTSRMSHFKTKWTPGPPLCCCRTTMMSMVFGKRTMDNPELPMVEQEEEVYCQAVDWLEGRLVGCCNPVSSMRMLRPSTRIPFQLFCRMHSQRLIRHNCCPGCGIFCTQGTFMQCKQDPTGAVHCFHRKCFQNGGGADGLADLVGGASPSSLTCPHCGAPAPKFETKLQLSATPYPFFCNQQKPIRKFHAARMITNGVSLGTMSRPSSPPPLRHHMSPKYVLPSGKEIDCMGLPEGLEKDQLEQVLLYSYSLAERGPRLSQKSLYQSSKAGDVDKVVQMLAQGMTPNHAHREYNGQTALHAAASAGQLVVVHVLVQAGAQLDTLDRDQQTPLMAAVLKSYNEVVKYLVKAGSCASLKGEDGMTSLHIAARSGNLEACHYVLGSATAPRGFINYQDDGGWTPLVWSAEHKHMDVARYLLEKNADPLIRDTEQNIALHWSALSGSMEVSQMLLEHGCSINTTNAHGDTPMHIGARQNNYECVLLFLSRGAKLDVKNKEGDTPLGCCPEPNCDSWTAISLNMQLRKLMSGQKPNYDRLLCNDVTKGKEQNPIQCTNNVDEEGIPTDYLYVTENCFTSNIHVDTTITSLKSCTCVDNCSTSGCFCGSLSWHSWYNEEGKLVPEFNYTDPPTIFECNSACACNKVTCNNRVVQHGVTIRMLLFRTPDKGWGVRTLRAIPRGSYVCEYIGELISDSEADHREDDSYLFDLDNRDGETYCIDARRYGNVARFINHMCEPNLVPVKVFMDHQDLRFPRMAFFAARDIEAEEELGFDYGEKFWIIKYKSFTCTCGSPKCKYSETTIQQTLENYKRRLQEESQREVDLAGQVNITN